MACFFKLQFPILNTYFCVFLSAKISHTSRSFFMLRLALTEWLEIIKRCYQSGSSVVGASRSVGRELARYSGSRALMILWIFFSGAILKPRSMMIKYI